MLPIPESTTLLPVALSRDSASVISNPERALSPCYELLQCWAFRCSVPSICFRAGCIGGSKIKDLFVDEVPSFSIRGDLLLRVSFSKRELLNLPYIANEL